MMGRWAIILFLLFYSIESVSGNCFQWQGEPETRINQYVTYYIDSADRNDEAYARSVLNRSFSSLDEKLINIGWTDHGVWFKVCVVNTSNQNDFLLEITNQFFDRIMMYEIDSEQRLTPLDIKGAKLGDNELTYDFSLAKYDTLQLLYKVEDEGSIRCRLNLWTTAAYRQYKEKSKVSLAFASGIMSFMVLMSLFFFFSVRERVYLWYAFVVLAYMYLLIGSAGHLHTITYRIPFLKGYDLRGSFNLVVLFFSANFLRYFFTDIPVWLNKALKYLSFVIFAVVLQPFNFYNSVFIRNLAMIILYSSMGIGMVLYFITIIHSLVKRFPGSLLLLISTTPIAILYILNLLRSIQLINHSFRFMEVFPYVFIFELTLMTLAVSIRFANYKKEKERYQDELLHQQLAFSNQLLQTQESERKTIAQNLHDGVGQTISTLKMQLSGFLNNNSDKLDDKQQEKLENNIELTENAYQQLRTISHKLIPKSLQENGLIPALETLVNSTFNADSIKAGFESLLPEDFRMDEKTEVALYRISQEAFNNIIKHSKAENVQIQIYRMNNELIYRIEDDGIGFEVDQASVGMGLKNLHARAELLNAHLNIESSKNKGTVLTIRKSLVSG